MSYEDGMPAGGNSRFRGYPARMSERQQLALLLQMTSQDINTGTNRSDTSNPSSSRSSPLHQRGGKSRWSNKNGDSSTNAPVNRKDDRVRQIIINGYNPTSKDPNEVTGTSSLDERRAIGESPVQAVLHGDCASTTGTASPVESDLHYQQQQHYYYQQHLIPSGSSATSTSSLEESEALCEMRRTPPQNKAIERSGSSQSGNSPRVTLRLNQVRAVRDDKKGAAGGGTSSHRQSGLTSQSLNQMDTSSKSTGIPPSGGGNVTGTSSSSGPGGNNSSSDSGDVYEFKSSKEATPVRGSSTSPNPNPEKDKDCSLGDSLSGNTHTGSQVTSSASAAGNSGVSSSSNIISAQGDAGSSISLTDDTFSTACSPSSKRSFEGDNADEQDEEIRKKKRKDLEGNKESSKGNVMGRQIVNKSNSGSSEKCAKSGKQGAGVTTGKNTSNNGSTNTDRKSPSSSLTANSPKPASASGMVGSKNCGSSMTPESDGEDERSKNSDSAPKVPPLKIVIPQSTTSEQEQGNRNGKNQSNRSHQLPYVVASSNNSNDSSDKDQSQSATGSVSPTEASLKSEDKKDFSGLLHNDDRSSHHQRVLRSSHRSGNGNGGNSKDNSGNSSGNGNYTNSSPLASSALVDRSNNSSPQPVAEAAVVDAGKSSRADSPNPSINKPPNVIDKTEKVDVKKETAESSDINVKKEIGESTNMSTTGSVELHPRKRKIKPNKEAQAAATAAANEALESTNTGPEIHPHDQPITNCYQLFLNIRKQIERRRKGLFPVQPKPPQGFKDYLMNRCTYVLASNVKQEPTINPPPSLQTAMKDLYIDQEKERYRLRMQHVVEKEKLVLSVEQEILRVHGRAARALANQSLPFSVCTILKDEEVYNVITPEQEEKDRNARSRYNGRLFLSWLQDVDDKWEKIKEAMLLRHHNEAESLHAVQRMDWEWKLKELGLCEFKATPQIDDMHVPMVHVSDDFDLLPA